jgi:hypothetical protein
MKDEERVDLGDRSRPLKSEIASQRFSGLSTEEKVRKWLEERAVYEAQLRQAGVTEKQIDADLAFQRAQVRRIERIYGTRLKKLELLAMCVFSKYFLWTLPSTLRSQFRGIRELTVPTTNMQRSQMEAELRGLGMSGDQIYHWFELQRTRDQLAQIKIQKEMKRLQQLAPDERIREFQNETVAYEEQNRSSGMSAKELQKWHKRRAEMEKDLRREVFG